MSDEIEGQMTTFANDDGRQEVCGVGYVNDEKKHVLISIRHPSGSIRLTYYGK